MTPEERRQNGPPCLTWPQISLLGEINETMVEKFLCRLREEENSGKDIVLEITTPGGDADLARRVVLEVQATRARMSRRFIFLGKTIVYSAGVTIMSAFPSEDRYLTRDTMLLIHCRQLEKTIEISGPMRSSLPKIEAARAQIQVGNGFEDQNFRRLVQGSDVSIDEVFEKALHNWYMPAADAMKRGLVADLI